VIAPFGATHNAETQPAGLRSLKQRQKNCRRVACKTGATQVLFLQHVIDRLNRLAPSVCGHHFLSPASHVRTDGASSEK